MGLTLRQKIKILELQDIIQELKVKEDAILRSFKNLEYDFETLVKKNEMLSNDNTRLARFVILATTKSKIIKRLYEAVKNGTEKA